MRKLKFRTQILVIFLLMLLVTLCTSPLFARYIKPGDHRIAVDDSWHFSNVGNLGLTVTNFGILGHGYTNPDQPSCWYKLRTSLLQDQVEHFSYAGIWFGGISDRYTQGQSLVSTAIYDGVRVSDNSGRGQEYTNSASASVKFDPIFVHLNKIDKRYDFSRLATDSVIVFNGSHVAPIENGYINFGTTNWDTIVTRSTIRDASVDNPYADYAQYYDPTATSHQDLICSFVDTNTVVPGTGITIPDHNPLGLHFVQEVYSWYDPFADAFTILNYTITNIPRSWEFAQTDTIVTYINEQSTIEVEYSEGDTIWHGDVITAPHFGIWLDTSVGNMIYTPTSDYDPNGGPGGRWNWYDNINDFDSTASRDIGMQWDGDGDAGWAQSYVGVKMLGAEPRSDTYDVYYHQWPWTGSSQQMDHAANFPMPVSEEDRYNVMTEHISYGSIPTDPSDIDSWMLFLSCGPLPDMAPGQRVKVAMAIVAGKWNGSGPDNLERRENLYRNADWAQVAYNGEDTNGNGVLDPGEDN
ncbi:hypothetical protein K8I28_14695, partial [bacterium]|nr:hypothetical protein [bacterium]